MSGTIMTSAKYTVRTRPASKQNPLPSPYPTPQNFKDARKTSLPPDLDLNLRPKSVSSTVVDTHNFEAFVSLSQQTEKEVILENQRPLPLRRVELRPCVEALRKAFQKCSGDDFIRVGCVISCVLSSRQQLSVQAVGQASALYVSHLERKYLIENDPSEFERWLSQFEYLFKTSESGQVVFALCEMPIFLWTYPVRGIDASQKTLSMLCLAQLELDRNLRNGRSMSDRDVSSFSRYAASNWQHHKRVASKSSMSLSMRGFTDGIAGSYCWSKRASAVDYGVDMDLQEGWEIVNAPPNED